MFVINNHHSLQNVSIIVLDEPTTGMDPVSRRYVWNHVMEVKKDKVVLLTTHAMEEADLLSDYVAILSQGTLAAFGSPLDLKAKYGSALQISLINDKSDLSVVKEEVDSTFADALTFVDLKMSDSGYTTLTIKRVRKEEGSEGVSPESLSCFVGWLEGEASPVDEFSISNSSLEEGEW